MGFCDLTPFPGARWGFGLPLFCIGPGPSLLRRAWLSLPSLEPRPESSFQPESHRHKCPSSCRQPAQPSLQRWCPGDGCYGDLKIEQESGDLGPSPCSPHRVDADSDPPTPPVHPRSRPLHPAWGVPSPGKRAPLGSALQLMNSAFRSQAPVPAPAQAGRRQSQNQHVKSRNLRMREPENHLVRILPPDNPSPPHVRG